jgi:hypothetical protein
LSWQVPAGSAIVAALRKARSADLVPSEAVVLALYYIADETCRGRRSTEVCEMFLDAARAAGIPESEIEAAMLAGNGADVGE